MTAGCGLLRLPPEAEGSRPSGKEHHQPKPNNTPDRQIMVKLVLLSIRIQASGKGEP